MEAKLPNFCQIHPRVIAISVKTLKGLLQPRPAVPARVNEPPQSFSPVGLQLSYQQKNNVASLVRCMATSVVLYRVPCIIPRSHYRRMSHRRKGAAAAALSNRSYQLAKQDRSLPHSVIFQLSKLTIMTVLHDLHLCWFTSWLLPSTFECECSITVER